MARGGRLIKFWVLGGNIVEVDFRRGGKDSETTARIDDTACLMGVNKLISSRHKEV